MISLRPLALLLLGALCALTPVWAQTATESTVTRRATELRQSPDEKSTSLASLPAQTALTRTSMRVGPWIQVKTVSAQTGWVHMFDLGAAGTPQPPSGNAATGALRGLSSFFSGGNSARNTTTATSTVGIRGLGAEDIANAQPNIDALGQVEAQRQDANQAKRFAAEPPPLSVRAVDNLPEPPPPTRSSPPGKTSPSEGLP